MGTITVETEKELKDALEEVRNTGVLYMVLGGGSNVLLTKDYPGIVILNRIKGIKLVEDAQEFVVVEAGSGEIWHHLVMYCVDHGFGGIENLSLIPGRVGAAPIQNIGAYGVELKDVFESLTAINTDTLERKTFQKKDCEFGYRDSVFKRNLKNRYIITSVRLKLKRSPETNISYGAIAAVLKEKNIIDPGIKDVSEAVIDIRSSKLPDPAVLGNSGSFFKNPVIKREVYQKLHNRYPQLPCYNVDDNFVKVPAGWMIEQCGLKGKRFGETGCHKDQALVIVNYGNATGKEIHEHALRVIDLVNKKFGIQLEPEVNII